MDECENLVIDLEEYEALDIKQQQHQQHHHLINDNEVELLELTAALDKEDIMVNMIPIYYICINNTYNV